MNRIIAAVSSEAMLEAALRSKADTVFYLAPNINTIADLVVAARSAKKRLFIHMDMAEGIASDRFGIEYVADLRVDGIISTRSGTIKIAKKHGLMTVQRFFIIDTHSISTTIDTASATNPDMIELMPGIAAKAIGKIKTDLSLPIIAGGLIESACEIEEALSAGAAAISTGKVELWDI